jgi:Autotransporter beta-domain
VLSGPPGSVTTGVTPRDGALFPEQNLGLLINSLGTVGTLLGEAAFGGSYGRPCVQGSAAPGGGVGGPAGAGTLAASNAAAGVGSAFCGAGGWIDTGGSFFHPPGFKTNTGGFMTGIDRPIGESGLRLGVAVGFGATWLGDEQGGNATENVARTGVYGSLPLGPVIIDGALGYGHDWNNTMRPTGVGTATASQNGNEYNGGFDVRVPLHLAGWTVIPGIGVGAAHITQPSFAESGPPGMTVTGNGVAYTGTEPYGQFEITRRFTTEGGMVIIPDFRIGYDYNSGNDLSEALNGNGTPFTGGPVKINPNSGVAAATLIVDRGWWFVFAQLGADLSSNWNDEHVKVGVRANF